MFQYANDTGDLAHALLNVYFQRQAEDRRNRLEQEAQKEREFQHGRETTHDQMSYEQSLLNAAPLLAEVGTTGPVLPALTGPGGVKTPLPNLTYENIRSKKEEEANRGTQVLTQEVWNNLPAQFQSIYSPGHRYKDESLGAIGKMVFDAATKKSEEEARFGHEKTLVGMREGNQNPAVTEFGGKKWQWDRVGKKWNELGDAKGPLDASAKKWYTETKTGTRVQLSQAELDAAAPGTYSDRPAASGSGGLAGASMQRLQDARKAAERAIGTDKDNKGDSIWAIVNRNTVPGPSGMMGPVAALKGAENSFNKATRGVFDLGGHNASDMRLYDSNIEGFLPIFARSVGHTGNLTDKEQNRARVLFPVLSGTGADTREEAIRKLRRVENIMIGKETVPDGIFDNLANVGGGGSSQDEQDLLKDYGFSQ